MKTSLVREALRISREKLPYHSWFKYRKCHFSFVVQNNKILGWGMNKPGKAPIQYKEYSAVHSEIDVLKKTRGVINFNRSFEIINIRLNRQGELRLSAPCQTCGKTIKALGCKNVYFSTDTDRFAKLVM